MRTLLVALAVMLAAMIEAGCRYANTGTSHVERNRHVNGGAERLDIGDGVTAIRYYESGVPGEIEDYLMIDIPNKSLSYETGRYLPELWVRTDPYLPAPPEPEIEAKINHVCNDAEWRFVVSNLNAMVVSKWKARYVNNDILDGTFWRLKLCNGTNVVREYSGSNAWPKRFSYFSAIKGFIRNHPAFVAAYPEIAEKDREFKEWIEHLRDSLKQK